MDRPTPRVNSVRISDYPGKIVRIVGKVLEVNDTVATIEASDAGQVQVKLAGGSSFSGEYVEVVGKVNASDNSITEFSSVDLGPSIDMGVVEKTVELWHQYPEVFPNA